MKQGRFEGKQKMSKDKSQSSHESKQPIFLTTKWRHLAMLNYEIDPAVLEPYLPAGTELGHL